MLYVRLERFPGIVHDVSGCKSAVGEAVIYGIPVSLPSAGGVVGIEREPPTFQDSRILDRASEER